MYNSGVPWDDTPWRHVRAARRPASACGVESPAFADYGYFKTGRPVCSKQAALFKAQAVHPGGAAAARWAGHAFRAPPHPTLRSCLQPEQAGTQLMLLALAPVPLL